MVARCVRRFHTQPLTFGHNCTYLVPQNLRANVRHFFVRLFLSPLCQFPLWCQPGTESFGLDIAPKMLHHSCFTDRFDGKRTSRELC